MRSINRAYNPLSVQELGRNAVRALMEYEIASLPPEQGFEGGGAYIIHYRGQFEPYRELGETPIYVGKADTDLYKRLGDHATSIAAAENIALEDFGCRWLVLESVWINLTEQILIRRYRPVWNLVLLGFGNHAPGSGRLNSRRPRWDTVHPGRTWAEELREGSKTAGELLEMMTRHMTKKG